MAARLSEAETGRHFNAVGRHIHLGAKKKEEKTSHIARQNGNATDSNAAQQDRNCLDS
jgi:hypothetical protein